MIVCGDREEREALTAKWGCADVVVAATPLEVIARLELDRDVISTTVVLAGVKGAASDAELEWFLEATYPWVRVVRAERVERMPAIQRYLRAHA